MKDRYAERQKTASLKDKRLITILRYILVLCPLSIVLCYFTGCSEYKVSDDPTLRLSFSHDTVRFDTVFTAQGSATMQVKVYNRNSNALLIDRVWMENGQFFRVNIDGETRPNLITSMQLDGGDSMYVFVRVAIDTLHQNNPVLVSDDLHFHLSGGATQSINLQAYGQDVERIGKSGCGTTEFPRSFTFTADRPYLLFDTVIINGQMTIRPGATLYMHQGACLMVYGNVSASGNPDQPIRICGDRLDRLFDSVPYRFAGGAWDGIYLIDVKDKSMSGFTSTYDLNYVDILSGTVGLMCVSDRTNGNLSRLTMNVCRIHNHSLYGLYISHMDACVTNTEISNCAAYCVYCDGGKHDFVHSTIASYFGSTNIRIQSVPKEPTAAVFINNLSKEEPATKTSFYNSIITGYLTNQLVVATPIDRYYPGAFIGNYLKTDTLPMPHAAENIYWQKDDTASVFVNDFYRYREYVYYNFHLDSLSPARGIGEEVSVIKNYPDFGDLRIDKDYDGVPRTTGRPDAGCYQHQP